jgi:hypothetical protein
MNITSSIFTLTNKQQETPILTAATQGGYGGLCESAHTPPLSRPTTQENKKGYAVIALIAYLI